MNDNNDESPISGFGRNALVNLLKATWKHQDHLWPATKAVTTFRSQDLRVSMASILRLEHNGKFVLIRNPNRPESFGPIGGVFKYFPSAQNVMDSFEFTYEQRKTGNLEDSERDLRGKISAKHLPIFLNWFKSRSGREEQDCIRRELREELGEIGIDFRNINILDQTSYSLVRRIHEGPYKHATLDIPQFRYFEVYRIAIQGEAKNVFTALSELAQNNENLLVARRDEIEKMRADNGSVIGGHSTYLFSSSWHGSEPPRMHNH